jgi:hypothetical protein
MNKEKFLNGTVCFGVLNPKGEPDGKVTTYFTESQLKKLESTISNANASPIPVYINHYTKDKDGKPVEPSGQVIFGKVRDDNGKFYVGIIFYDTPNGKLATSFLTNKNLPMGELSLGYKVFFKENGKNIDIIGNEATEVSICYRGDREGTKIGHVTTLKNVLNVGKNVFNNPIVNNIKNQNFKQNQNIQIKEPSFIKNSTSNKMDINSSNDYGFHFVDGASHHEIAATPNFSTIFNSHVNGVARDDSRIHVVDTTASLNDASDPPSVSGMHIQQNASVAATETPDVNLIIKKFVSDYKDNGQINEDAIKDYIYKLKQSSAQSDSDGIGLQITDSQLSTKLAGELDELRKKRPTIPDEIDPALKSKMHELYANEERALKEEHTRLLQKDFMLRTELQKSMKQHLPNLIKSSENANGQQGGLNKENIKYFVQLLSKASELGPEFADGALKYLEATASMAEEVNKSKTMSATALEALLNNYSGASTALTAQNQKFNEMDQRCNQLEKENNMLKQNLPVGAKAQAYDNNSDNKSFKKIKTTNSSNEFFKPVKGDDLDLSRYGKAALGASNMLYGGKNVDPSFIKNQARTVNEIMKFADAPLNCTASVKRMQERFVHGSQTD